MKNIVVLLGILFLGLIAFTLSSCDTQASSPEPEPVTSIVSQEDWIYVGRGEAIKRIEYPDMTCIISDGYKAGGISCVKKDIPSVE